MDGYPVVLSLMIMRIFLHLLSFLLLLSTWVYFFLLRQCSHTGHLCCCCCRCGSQWIPVLLLLSMWVTLDTCAVVAVDVGHNGTPVLLLLSMWVTLDTCAVVAVDVGHTGHLCCCCCRCGSQWTPVLLLLSMWVTLDTCAVVAVDMGHTGHLCCCCCRCGCVFIETVQPHWTQVLSFVKCRGTPIKTLQLNCFRCQLQVKLHPL